jgi:glycosyltransferase involved in cell wall biosynthesis
MAKIRIGLEIGVTQGKASGVGVYVSELMRHFSDEIEVVPLKASNADLSTPKRFLADQLLLPRLASKARIDLLHQPAFSCPLLYKKTPKILTVHDLIPLILPENFKPVSAFFWRSLLPYSIKKADFIITVSFASKKDLMTYLQIPEEKIAVTYLGVDERFKPGKIVKNPPYILFVSTLEPRKQPLLLLKVLKGLIEAGLPHRLKIVGKRGWAMEKFDAYLKDHPEVLARTDILDYVDEKEKISLYQGAELFLFPSLYEGFGLPPLEAMACGVPVVASAVASLPEVIGDAGLLLPPKDERLWVKRVIKLLKSEGEKRFLRERGLKRVQLFSWQKCAQATEAVYKKVLGMR